jgi:threonine dehydrogenase-like Zn-dependent dehydrogenase
MPWACPDEAGGRQTCHTALVLGAGPVGLLGAMKLVIEGFRTFVYSRGSETEKPPLVQAIGATFLSTDSVEPKDLPGACGAQIDVVYEAMGAADLAFAVIRELGRNAIFVFTGVPGRKNPIPVDTATIMRDMVLKNQLILGTVNAGPIHFQNAIADLGKFRAKFPDAVANLITHRYPIEEYRQPLSSHDGIKNVISLNGA